MVLSDKVCSFYGLYMCLGIIWNSYNCPKLQSPIYHKRGLRSVLQLTLFSFFSQNVIIIIIVYTNCFMLQASERGGQSGPINKFVFKLVTDSQICSQHSDLGQWSSLF